MLLSWSRLVATLWSVATIAAHAASVPNASFDEGELEPRGWTVGSGAGDWGVVDDNRAVISRGTAQQTSFWRSAPVGFESGALYRLRFRARRLAGLAGSGTVMSGAVFANRDLGTVDLQWRIFTSFFAVPDKLEGRDWLRFGQWHLDGRIAFDDISLQRVQAVHRQVQAGLLLGEGERIFEGNYLFHAPLRSELANYSRPLQGHSASFNSHRWVFSADQDVRFVHEIDGHAQQQARIFVNVNYHTGGRLVVEVRTTRGDEWLPVGHVETTTSATFDVPEWLLPASSMHVRLRAVQADTGGEGADPGSFQVDDYQYEADLAGDPAEAEGDSQLLTLPADSAATDYEILDLGALQPGQSDSLTVVLGTEFLERAQSLLRTRVLVAGLGEALPDTGWSPSKSLPASGRLRLPYQITGSGDRVLHVQLDGGSSWHAEIDLQASVLHADNYGESLSEDLWWAPSSWKVSATRAAPSVSASQMYISLARNEAEAAQLILRPGTDLQDLVVQVTDLRNSQGARIPADAIEVLRVGTVPVQQATDRTGESGDWPDPLLPINGPLSVRADHNLALWVRATTTAQTPAGVYRGHIQLRADDWADEVELVLEVFDFQLPDKMTCQTAFGFNPEAVWRYHRLESEADRRLVLEKYLQSFARHHISPYDPAPLDPPRIDWPDLTDSTVGVDAVLEPDIDWRAWDAAMTRAIEVRHFNSFRLSIPGIGGGSYVDRREPELLGWTESTPQYQALFRGYGQALERHLTERGWLDEAFVYWFDEPAPRDYVFVMNGFRRLREAAPGITRMLTEQVETDLLGGPNLWCPVTPSFDADLAASRRDEGERFWWYICTVPKAPWAGLFVDRPATELRVWLWQTWQHDVEGILIWATNYWTSEAAYPHSLQNPYEDAMSWESAYNAPIGTRRPWGNGDGRFLYPPTEAFSGTGPVLQGPVESIRWEMLRDGIEDYEYLAMLRRTLKRAEPLLSDEEYARYQNLLQVPENITSSLTDFTTNPAPIEVRRRAMARALVELLQRVSE